MEGDSMLHLENPLQSPITVRQLDILRLLGKGNSFKDRDTPQQFDADAKEEMGKIYASFGVTGERAAVVHALSIGVLETAELIEEKFDWRKIDRLKPQHKALLEAYTHSKYEDLTDEEFNNLNVKTSRNKKDYAKTSEEIICDHLKLGNITVAVVHYIAWRERQPEIEQADNMPVETALFTDRQAEVFRLLAQGLDPSMIAVRLNIAKHTVWDYRSEILKTLEVTSIKEAEKKAREMGGDS